MVYNDIGSFKAGSDLVATTWINMDPIIKVQSLCGTLHPMCCFSLVSTSVNTEHVTNINLLKSSTKSRFGFILKLY